MLGPDLREWVTAFEKEGQLEKVEGADWNLELGGITCIMFERKDGPAVLFDKIKGYPAGYRVMTNIMGSPRRFGMAVGIETSGGRLGMVQAWREKMRDLQKIPHQEVKAADFQKNVMEGDDVDLFKFPAPYWNELDGGRYLGTGCAVITKDPDSDWINVGTYRAQLMGKDVLGFCVEPGGHARFIREKYYSRGEPCPVAIVLGGDPLVFLAATLRLPDGLCEYDFAGGIRGKAVQVVKSELTGLPIPADSEVVAEGFSYPGDEMVEGPFGEWMGYYAGTVENRPVTRVKRVMYRDNPIIHGYPNLRPPYGVPFYRPIIAAAKIWDQLERAGLPGVTGVWCHEAAATRYLIAVSIKQRYSGHSKQALMLTSQLGETFLWGRFTVVVDDDVDVTNLDEVIWAVGSRCDPQRDIDLMKRTTGTFSDPCIGEAERGLDSRALIDACRPFNWIDRFPPIVQLKPEFRQELEKKWAGLFAKYT